MNRIINPLAITMWDFSWIERRWPGAGYEDWDKALDELLERGYNAVRIDAFPHLIHEDCEKTWTLNPVWYSNDWGSPYINKVTLMPDLLDFIRKCGQRKIKVGLSSWFREDVDNIRMKIDSPQKMAEIWISTLQKIDREGLLEHILYVDLCNEWPGDIWAPYFINDPKDKTWGYWHTDKSMEYMKESVNIVKREYPVIPVCYSFDGLDYAMYNNKNLDFFDLIEHHMWAVKLNNNEFYELVGPVKDGRFTMEAYHKLSQNALKIYYERPEYWKNLLKTNIHLLASAAAKANQPLITTECWGIVDYKDFPLLDWDWVKELCEVGTIAAADTGQWVAIATSNFCGPQFIGMWRDVEWHKKMTNYIKSSRVCDTLHDKKICRQ